MYCPKCGAQNPDNSKFCGNCGTALQTAPVAPVTAAPVETARNNSMAVASLVMGIIGFFINPLSILAIIFGAIALGQIARDPKAKGKGMATTGLVLGVVVAAFWIIALFWLGSALWWVSGRF